MRQPNPMPLVLVYRVPIMETIKKRKPVNPHYTPNRYSQTPTCSCIRMSILPSLPDASCSLEGGYEIFVEKFLWELILALLDIGH